MACVESIDHDHVRELRLARPPVNALNPALCTDLADAVAACAIASRPSRDGKLLKARDRSAALNGRRNRTDNRHSGTKGRDHGSSEVGGTLPSIPMRGNASDSGETSASV